MVLLPRDSAKFISSVSKDVTVVKNKIPETAEMLLKGLLEEERSTKSWKSHPLNPKDAMLPFTVDWIFLLDTLNFSFWTESDKKYKITFHGETYTGYWSLCAAVNRAIEEGYDITSPVYYSDISMDTLKHIFRSDTGVEMPMIEDRKRILNETGKCLVEKFEGTFVKCLAQCEKSAMKLLQLIVENFPSYRDEAEIDGHKVSFYKRAQILIGDIWCCFDGKGCGTFHDIDAITIFADYRIPQVLVHMGLLKYSDDLLKELKSGKILKSGDRYEVEIRGCSIWAVELICQYLKEKQDEGKIHKDCNFNSILIDHFLWEYRRKHAEELEYIPFHKVRCIYY